MSSSRSFSASALAALSVFAAFVVACSSSERSGFSDSTNATDPANEGDFGTTEDGGVQKSQCTADLQGVIEANGNIVSCPEDQGCAGGQCVPACDAAAASKGSLGCQYRVATPAFHDTYPSPCFAVFIANGWQTPAKLSVSLGAQSYDVTKFGRIAEVGKAEASWVAVPGSGIPAGKVAVLFLQSGTVGTNGGAQACPVTPAILKATGLRTSGRGTPWNITSDVPVTAYDIMPYGGASSFLPSAELLAPVTAWSTNYLAVLPPPSNRGDSSGKAWGQIVAAEDGTTVTISSTADLPAGLNLPAVPANTVTKIKLDADEFLQWEGGKDMTGSVIEADKPISFTGGNTYLCYATKTSTGGGCDSGHQQIPPVSALGSRYAVAPYPSRIPTLPESIRYRIVGAVDGTTLTYEPAVSGAPKTLKSGQVVDFETTASFVIQSQDADHPFYIGQTMGGCIVGSSDALGDEEFVNILPPAQFLNGYVFFTDPTYTTTNLVVTRVKSGSGFSDVEIDCYGKVTDFEPVGDGSEYESATVELVGSSSSKCKNGPHTIKSDAPVGVTVWGLASYSSYAYPAGGSTAPINTVVVQPR